MLSTVLACLRPLSNCTVPSKAAYSRIQLNLIMYADSPLPISSSSKPWQNAFGHGACNNAVTQKDKTRDASIMRQDGRCQFCIHLAVPILDNACMDMASSAMASTNVCYCCVKPCCSQHRCSQHHCSQHCCIKQKPMTRDANPLACSDHRMLQTI